MKIECIDFKKGVPTFFYGGMQRHMDIDLVRTPSAECDVLFVPIASEEALQFLEKTVIPNTCFTIFMVIEFTGAIAPYLKLADYIFYFGPRQKDIADRLLDTPALSEYFSFPHDMENVPKQRDSVFLYLPISFTPDSIPFVEECISLSRSWYPVGEEGRYHLVMSVAEEHYSAYLSFKDSLLEQEENRAFNFHVKEELMEEEIVDLIKISSYGDCFSQELSNEQVDELLAKKDPALLYIPFTGDWIIEDMVRYGIKWAHDFEGVKRSLLMDNHTPYTFDDFADRLTEVLSIVRPIIEEKKSEKLHTVEVDTLEDLHILHGEPLKNRFVFSICFRNQEEKIIRALDSILDQEGDFDYGIAIVDDCSVDASSERILEKLQNSGVDFMLVKNKDRKYAARNFYNIAHLLCASDTDSILIELDGDDFLHGTKVLQHLVEAYSNGALKTCGSFRVYPDHMAENRVGKNLLDKQGAIDFTKPWNLSQCNSWLPLRSCKLDILRAVEIDYFLERESKSWLMDRHDAITQSRIIELAGPDGCHFIDEPIYVYDLSGADHDHGSSEEYDYSSHHMKLFRDLNKYYRAYTIY